MKLSHHDHSTIMAAHWASVDQMQLDQDDADQAKSVLDAIGQLADVHVDSRITIMGNSEYSESGKDSKIRALVGTSDERLKKISAPLIAKLQSKILDVQKAIASATNITPTVQDTLKHIEIRTLAADFNDLELFVKLESLALSGKDDQTLQAVLSASSLKPLLRPEDAVRIRELFAARKAPDHTAAADKASETLATINNAVRTVSHAIASPIERGRLGIDGVATLAAGASIPRSQAPGA